MKRPASSTSAHYPRATLGWILLSLLLGGCNQVRPENQMPAAAAPAVPAPTATRSFDVGMVTFAGYAPFFLAKEKGFFGSLDVQLKRIEEISSIRAAMMNGELEAYLATPDIALDTNTRPIGQAVWAIDESTGGDGVVVAEGIRDLKALKNRRIAGEPGLPPTFVLMYLLSKHGMSLEDVKYLDMTTQNAASAFATRAIDAAAVYEPYLSTARTQRKGSRVAISSKEMPGVIVDLVFVRPEITSDRAADVATVITGWRKALAYIKSHPDDAYAIMARAFNQSPEAFRDAASGVRWLDLADNRSLFGQGGAVPLAATFDTVGGVLRKNRPSVFAADARAHIVDTFVREQQ